MNVQINPLNTPPLRDDDRDDNAPAGRGRVAVIGGVALALALGGFWYFTHSSAPPPRRMMAAPVHVAPVQVGNMSVIERTIGTVLANSTVSVNARIQGQMVKAFFKEGQMVKAGDPLFQIDPRPYQATYDNALASLASAKAKAKFAEIVLLPTPPFPLTTAMIFLTFAKTVFSSFLKLLVLEVKSTLIMAALFTSNLMAFSQAFFIKSFIGQAGVVSTMVKLTSLPSTFKSLIILSVTKSLPKSGSCTLLNAFNISASVILKVFVK
jgi:hypothetical protein